ncbi:MAG: hypothetical protein JNL90_15750 [Planctomycetes bacterium]|nr:hypothetical protein [Planctomycetota bacterium]
MARRFALLLGAPLAFAALAPRSPLAATSLAAPPLAAPLLAAPLAALPESTTLDFAKEKLPDGWVVATKSGKVIDGELRFSGDGALTFAGPISSDFRFTCKGMSAEKANFELKVEDATTGAELYTFAFLGRYHSALDGVKCCLLRQDGFVAIDPRMWTFPGRWFTFEMRAAKGQLQMFLDGTLGPVFVDPQPLAPAKGIRLRLLVATEGSKDEVRLDDVTLEWRKP